MPNTHTVSFTFKANKFSAPTFNVEILERGLAFDGGKVASFGTAMAIAYLYAVAGLIPTAKFAVLFFDHVDAKLVATTWDPHLETQMLIV